MDSENKLAVTYSVDGQELTLTPAIVCRYLLGGRGDIPEAEIVRFMALCRARKLNPFTGDVYMTAYSTREGVRTSVVVGKETFTKRAQRNPRFRGIEAGVTVMTADGSRILRRDGSMVLDGERLVGGWARVYIEGWEKPGFDEVSVKEYTTGKSMWLAKPATMIRKVAIVHVLREAFPDEFGGLYDASEMGVDQPTGTFEQPEQLDAEEAEPQEAAEVIEFEF